MADFSIPVHWTSQWSGTNTQVGPVLPEMPDGEFLNGRVLSREYRLIFPATQFPGIAYGDVIQITQAPADLPALNGDFHVQSVQGIGDGKFVEARIERDGTEPPS